MSSLPLPSSADPTKSPPAPRGVQFVTLAEASLRSGLPVETIKRWARGEWSTIGLSMLAKPVDGGKPCWHVREDADGRFARVKSPDLLPIDWGKVGDVQRAKVQRARRLLGEWLAAREQDFERGFSERESTAAFVARCAADSVKVSRMTLFRWFKAFGAAGLAGLVDARMNVGHNDPRAEAFVEELKRLFLSPRRRSKALCFDLAVEKAEDKGWSIPFDKRQAANVLNAIDRKVASYHRDGPRAYASKHGPHAVRSYSAMESNQLWISDGHKLDVFADHNGKLVRPTLVSWMDARSRFVVGWRIVAGGENSDVILAAFRDGVRSHGLPMIVHHDNGEAYDAQALQGVTKRRKRAGERPCVDLGIFPRLDVAVRHSLPYNAKSKTVERWHRTIKDRLCVRFDTFTGGTPAEKPHDLEANKERGKAPTLDELRELFRDWLDADYHHRDHHGTDMNGETPAGVYCANLKQKRVIADDMLELETCRREKITVGRNGVRWGGITYGSAELDMMSGRDVFVLITDESVGAVKVLDARGRFLCVAKSVRPIDYVASVEDVRETMAEQARDRKRVKAAGPAAIRLSEDPFERLQRRAESKRATAPKPSPASLKPVRSKLEGDAAAIQHADSRAERPAGALRLAEDVPRFSYADLLDDEPNKAVNE